MNSIKLKKKLNSEINRLLSNTLFDVYRETPISIALTSSVHNRKKNFVFRKALSVFALIFVLFFSGISVSDLAEKSSKITCVILDIAPTIQLVVEDGNIVSVNALDESGQIFVDVNGESITGLDLAEGVEVLIERAYSCGYISSSDNDITAKAINNDETAAERCLSIVQKGINRFVDKSDVALVLKKEVIDYQVYNEIVFGGEEIVDDLDCDAEEVLNP